MDEQPELSIVVLNFRTPEETAAAVQSALAAADGVRAEVIVVDNASGDGSVEYCRRHLPEARIIEMDTNRGFAAGMNAGIRQSRGDFLLLLNSDVKVEPGSLAVLLEYMRSDPEVAVAAPMLLDRSGRPSRSLLLQPTVPRVFIPWVGKVQYRRWQQRLGKMPLEVEAAEGAALLVRRAAIEQAGLLDEDFFFYHEIVEWCLRIRDCGFRIVVVPESQMVHACGGSTSGVRRAARIELKRSEYQLLKKRLGRAASNAVIVRDIISELASTFFYGALRLLSFGGSRRVREKLVLHWAVWRWIVMGMPQRDEASYQRVFGRWG